MQWLSYIMATKAPGFQTSFTTPNLQSFLGTYPDGYLYNAKDKKYHLFYYQGKCYAMVLSKVI